MKKIKLKKDFARPWGGFIKFIENKPCTVKILKVKKGESLSLQSHKKREEFWYVISGKIKVSRGPIMPTIEEIKKNLKRKTLSRGETLYIPKKFVHKIEGFSSPFSEILEISTGKFEEKDEIRYEDRYGRI